jgi:hypothetical protein
MPRSLEELARETEACSLFFAFRAAFELTSNMLKLTPEQVLRRLRALAVSAIEPDCHPAWRRAP